LRDRRRVGEAPRLHQYAVEGTASPHQADENTDQVAPYRATDATVIHFEYFFVGIDDEIVVDPRAKFVDNHGVMLAVRLAENAI
jgi:non-canonical (house-cleaning) NTP pyrophosphatase